jgi:hypothetical protein
MPIGLPPPGHRLETTPVAATEPAKGKGTRLVQNDMHQQ